MIDTNKFIDESKKILNTITDTIGSYASAGKQRIDVFTLEGELGKAQKQLGALVYSLHKTNQEDAELVEQYIETIDDIYDRIERAKTLSLPTTHQTRHCSDCGNKVGVNDVFCPKCGQRQM